MIISKVSSRIGFIQKLLCFGKGKGKSTSHVNKLIKTTSKSEAVKIVSEDVLSIKERKT